MSILWVGENATRRHQGRFRDTSSTVSLGGRSPSDDKGLRNPHLLALGCEEENLYPCIRGAGGTIEFFSQRGFGWWKSSRSGDDSKAHGPTRNMVSSQVACVNFLLPLAGIPGGLVAAIRSIDDVSRAEGYPAQGNRILLSEHQEQVVFVPSGAFALGRHASL